MADDPPQELVRARFLSANRVAELEALINACRKREGLEVHPRLMGPSEYLGAETNWFLYYRDGTLAAVAALATDERAEFLSVVYPEHRRRGIGRALLAAAMDECRRRGITILQLLCDDVSSTGTAFAEAMGARYHSSRHRMRLDATAVSPSSSPGEAIAMDPADLGDLDTLVRLCAASADESVERLRTRVVRWLVKPTQRFYIGRLADQAIGVVRSIFYREIADIAFFRVLPGFEGYGFDRQILESASAVLIDEGKTVWLEAKTDDDTLLLYRSCGFRTISTYRHYELQA